MSNGVLDQDKEKLLEMPSPVNSPAHTARLKAMAVAAFVVGCIVYGVLRDEEGVMLAASVPASRSSVIP